MAIHKSIEMNDSGVAISYWRITAVQLDHQVGAATFNVHGYISEEARQAGKMPLPVITAQVTAGDLGIDSLHNLSTADLYKAILNGAVKNNEQITLLQDGESV